MYGLAVSQVNRVSARQRLTMLSRRLAMMHAFNVLYVL